MKIIACYKIVPDEQGITVLADRSLAFDKAELVVSQYDFNAIEAGVQLAAANGGEVVALTVGGAEVENSKLKKGVLSRGCASLVAVNEPAVKGADAFTTSAYLADAVKKVGDFDLVLCGEGSSDLYAQQTGIMLGERLGVPAINGVIGIEACDGGLKVTRSADGETETLTVALPAVLSVSSSINRPRVPSMKDILGAGKKPATIVAAGELGTTANANTETVSMLAPAQADRARKVFTGDDADTLAAFAAAVSAELK